MNPPTFGAFGAEPCDTDQILIERIVITSEYLVRVIGSRLLSTDRQQQPNKAAFVFARNKKQTACECVEEEANILCVC